MSDMLCECPLCGRNHRRLGTPPFGISYAAACRLSREFDRASDLRTEQDQRINHWLARVIATLYRKEHDMLKPKNCEIRITFRAPTSKKPEGHLGASSSYDPLPGEDWRRGNDLADGPANEETVRRIAEDIRALIEGFRNAYERDHAGE